MVGEVTGQATKATLTLTNKNNKHTLSFDRIYTHFATADISL